MVAIVLTFILSTEIWTMSAMDLWYCLPKVRFHAQQGERFYAFSISRSFFALQYFLPSFSRYQNGYGTPFL